MSEDLNVAGRLYRKLNGESVTYDTPFEQPSRIIDKLNNGGGGGGVPADYDELKNTVSQLSNTVSQLVTGSISTNERINSLYRINNLGQCLFCTYEELQSNQMVRFTGNSINTGLTLNGEAEFRATCCLESADNQGIIIGAYSSNSARTALKFLGQSQKIQSQWADNIEIVDLQGIDLTKTFSYVQNKNTTTITQNGITLTCNNSGYSLKDENVPILLFNQTVNGYFNHCLLKNAEIIIDEVSYKFTPLIKKTSGVGPALIEPLLFRNGVIMDLNGSLEIVQIN